MEEYCPPERVACLTLVESRVAALTQRRIGQPFVCYLESVWARCPVLWETT
jgi:hypothetical protein